MLPMPREPRVQHHPYGLFGIETDFDEVVAATQRSELLLRLLRLELRILRRDDVTTLRSERAQRASTESGVIPQEPRSSRPRVFDEPCGTARSMRDRSAANDSGRSLALSEVCTAIMPQPMSTPTAAGMIAPCVAITEPTVAPLPTCTSGITARCECTNGMRAMFSSCFFASSSIGHAVRPHLHVAAALDVHRFVVAFFMSSRSALQSPPKRRRPSVVYVRP